VHKESGLKSKQRVLLEPHEVSLKVKGLAAENRLGDAVNLVLNLPLGALNVQACNTLLHEANMVKRYSLAWKLFNKVKRF
jgi:hypothetical protein